ASSKSWPSLKGSAASTAWLSACVIAVASFGPSASRLIGSHPDPADCAGLAAPSRDRSPSKELLLKRSPVPQNRCYRQRTRKGGPVTERARREYAEAVR